MRRNEAAGSGGESGASNARNAVTTTSPSSQSHRKDLPPLFWYMEGGDWEKAADRVRRHPREAKTWATLKTKSLDTDGSTTIGQNAAKLNNSNNDSNHSQSNNSQDFSATSGTPTVGSGTPVTTSTKRLALHHACFKLRAAGALPPPSSNGRKTSADPFIEVCQFILLLIRLYPDAAARRESRHGCLPIHLAAFASCIPRSGEPTEKGGTTLRRDIPSPSSRLGSSFDGESLNHAFTSKAAMGSNIIKPKVVSMRSESEGTTDTIQTNMSAVQAEENYTGELFDKHKTLRHNLPNMLHGGTESGDTNAQRVSVSMRSNMVISAKREEMLVQVINALLDAYPKAARVDSEGGRLPLHTACAGRATPRVISTLITAYPAACRQRNKDGFLPLHLAAHWGVSHPAVAVQLLRAYPDATVGRNRWERTPLEEALCMAGENGRPHQSALVRALRKHPSYWTRPNFTTDEFGFGLSRPGSSRGHNTAVDIDESLPSNDSVDDNDENLQMTRYYNQARHLIDEGIIDEEDEEDDEDEIIGVSHNRKGAHEFDTDEPSSPGKLMQRLSPRGSRNRNISKKDQSPSEDTSKMSLSLLIEKRKWKSAVARVLADPLSAERELKVMTRGGFMASTGMSPLHYACERKPPVQLVKVLIEAFPFAVLTRAMPGGCLPLHIACTWGSSPDIVEALLAADHGSVKVKDELGNVALHSACFSGADIKIIAMLLATDGKSVVARNHQGSRPIDICKRLRHDNRREVMNLLNRKKEEMMRKHGRNHSSGLLADIAKEAEDMNQGYNVAVPFAAFSKNDAYREDDIALLDQQAVEVTYDEQDKNHELLWV